MFDQRGQKVSGNQFNSGLSERQQKAMLTELDFALRYLGLDDPEKAQEHLANLRKLIEEARMQTK